MLLLPMMLSRTTGWKNRHSLLIPRPTIYALLLFRSQLHFRLSLFATRNRFRKPLSPFWPTQLLHELTKGESEVLTLECGVACTCVRERPHDAEERPGANGLVTNSGQDRRGVVGFVWKVQVRNTHTEDNRVGRPLMPKETGRGQEN